LCDQAKVTIDILANPDGNSTFATDDTFYGKEDTSLTGNVLSNDNDPEGDTQHVSGSAVVQPQHGTLVLSTSGSFTYTPVPNYVGADRFVYQVCDNGTPVACGTATVYLVIGQDDDQPIANDDTNSTSEENSITGSVIGNDLQSNDGLNTWAIVKQPSHGDVVMKADGTYTYTPDLDFFGNDSFTYQICDVDGDCDEATVRITVTGVDDFPEADDDVMNTFLDGVLNETVADNDFPSGDGGNIWSIVTPPANGRLVLNADGSYIYTPNIDFNGSDTFTYKLCDTDGDCAEAKVTISIQDIIIPNQVMTPNGDNTNDTFIIQGIEYYPGNKLTVFNRWGNVVYEKSGYLNEWDGYSNKGKVGSTSLPVGTYFFILDYGVGKHKTGYVYLER
jgi:gliding motility-associated-like protein